MLSKDHILRISSCDELVYASFSKAFLVDRIWTLPLFSLYFLINFTLNATIVIKTMVMNIPPATEQVIRTIFESLLATQSEEKKSELLSCNSWRLRGSIVLVLSPIHNLG